MHWEAKTFVWLAFLCYLLYCCVWNWTRRISEACLCNLTCSALWGVEGWGGGGSYSGNTPGSGGGLGIVLRGGVGHMHLLELFFPGSNSLKVFLRMLPPCLWTCSGLDVTREGHCWFSALWLPIFSFQLPSSVSTSRRPCQWLPCPAFSDQGLQFFPPQNIHLWNHLLYQPTSLSL